MFCNIALVDKVMVTMVIVIITICIDIYIYLYIHTCIYIYTSGTSGFADCNTFFFQFSTVPKWYKNSAIKSMIWGLPKPCNSRENMLFIFVKGTLWTFFLGGSFALTPILFLLWCEISDAHQSQKRIGVKAKDKNKNPLLQCLGKVWQKWEGVWKPQN